MMYTTSTSRRVVKVKVKKTRTQQRNMWTPPPTINGPTQGTTPPLFDRVSPYRRRIEQTPPWYKTWKAILPLLLLPVAALAYAFVTPSETEKPSVARTVPAESGYAGARPTIRSASGAEVIQLRPMGYAGSAGHGNAGHAGGIAHETSSQTGMPAARKAELAAANVGSEERVLESIEQNRKIVLPENVAGNCNIAQAGLKDLSSCMVRNGARAN